jgi:hypothetical protein
VQVEGNATLIFQGVSYLPGDSRADLARTLSGLAARGLPFSGPSIPLPENPVSGFSLQSNISMTGTLLGINSITQELVTFNLSGSGSADAGFFPASASLSRFPTSPHRNLYFNWAGSRINLLRFPSRALGYCSEADC